MDSTSQEYSQTPSQGHPVTSNARATLRPVTISQVLLANEQYSGGDFEIDGLVVSSVSLVAHVVKIRLLDGFNVFELEDGTGREMLTATQWLIHSPEVLPRQGNRVDFEENEYAHIIGKLKRNHGLGGDKSRNELSVSMIKKIKAPMQIFHHVLDVMYTMLVYERGPPPQEAFLFSTIPPTPSQEIPSQGCSQTSDRENDSVSALGFGGLTISKPPSQGPIEANVSTSSHEPLPPLMMLPAAQARPPTPIAGPSQNNERPSIQDDDEPDDDGASDYQSCKQSSTSGSRPPTPEQHAVEVNVDTPVPRGGTRRDPLSNLSSLEREIYLCVQRNTSIPMVYSPSPNNSEWINVDLVIQLMGVRQRQIIKEEFAAAISRLIEEDLLEEDGDEDEAYVLRINPRPQRS